ncbi:uncharacterized protein [Procambarus clarkii]|uniref:uncharacterized protein n=1 Tax=Procambarus clarkii TaxID=6728 RepID=UPI00374353C7
MIEANKLDLNEKMRVKIVCTVFIKTIDAQSCSATAPYLVGAQVVQNFTWNSNTVYGVYYECNDGLQMMSGYPGRLTQCVGGRWTGIFDVCIEAYCPQRDCCAVAALNYTNNDGTQYTVAPSAYRGNNTIQCFLLLMKDVTIPPVLLVIDEGCLWALTALNWDGNTKRPLVMKIMMKDMNDNTLHATYGRLVVNPNNYTLSSLGTYHGNAGDHLAGSVGNTFCPVRDPNNTNPCWWGDPSTPNSGLLTGDTPTWGSISIKSLNVWVRSLDCDKELACPPLNTAINLANESYIPVSRAPGTSFQYICPGDLMMAGKPGISKTPQGQVTCLPNTTNNLTPTWDVVFPCVLVCPSDYVMSVNSSTCYYFSLASESKSHTDALTSCASKNSSLAFLNNPKDMKNLTDNSTFYLTAYTLTRDETIFPYMRTWEDHGFNCTQKYHWCPTGGQERCFILHRAGYFNVSDCQTSNRYICQRPAMCPHGYTLYKSRCYKLLMPSANTTFLDALNQCNYDGSALAYPQNLDALNFLTIFAKVVEKEVNWSSQASVNIAVGYTNMKFVARNEHKSLVSLSGREATVKDLRPVNPPRPGYEPKTKCSRNARRVSYHYTTETGIVGNKGIESWKSYVSTITADTPLPQIYKKIRKIAVDFCSALMDLESFNLVHLVVVEIQHLLFLFSSKYKSVEFCWVPSHIGVSLNEREDADTREAIRSCPIWDDLTVAKIYTPDANITALVQSLNRIQDFNYTYLSVNNSGQGALTPANVNSTVTYALCEFRGPLGYNPYLNRRREQSDVIEPIPHSSHTELRSAHLTRGHPPPLHQGQPPRQMGGYENGARRDALGMVTNPWYSLGRVLGELHLEHCWPGYFVNADVGNKTKQYLWCHGQLGGWFPRQPPLIPCIGVDVCNETFPPTPPNMNQNLGDHPRYETYSLSYSCKSDDMTNMAGEHTQVLTCTEYNGTYAYNRTNVTACDRCFNPPPLDYANTTFASRPVWVIGDQANATCDPSHQVAHNVTQQLVNCTILGWQMLPCQRVCLEAPNVTNATTNWVDNMWTVNKNVTANCLGNLYFPKLKSQTRPVTCTWNGWDNTPTCMQVCLGDPVVQNATVDLQNVMWAVGEAPTATCFEHYMFLQEATKTQPIMCTSQGWENRTGCVQVCDQPPNVPNAITAWTPSQVWPVGSTVNGSCNSDAVIIPGGDLQFTVQCTNSGWTTNSCQKVCSLEPQVVNATTNWTNGLWPVGSAVDATCLGNLTFIASHSSTRLVSCTLTGWQNSPPCDELKPSLPCSVEPKVDNANTSWENRTWGVGNIITATCSFPLYYFNDSTQQQQLECTKDGWENITGCSKPLVGKPVASVECREEPEVNNTNSTWVDRDWYVGENVTVTCIPDHWFISDDTDHLQVNCTWDGWTNLSGCEKVCHHTYKFSLSSYTVNIGKECSVVPLVENANTTWRNRTWFVGDNVTATCLPGFIFVVNNASQSPITCTAQGWQNLTGCQIVCEEELSVEGAMNDWSSTVVWPLGAKVNATCLQGHYILPEGNLTQTVECTSQGWRNATPCEPGCTEELALEAANGSAIWQWETRVWSLDENLTASCSDQYLTHNGTNTTNFTCTPTGWLILAPCLRVCEGEPSVDNGSTTWVPGLWLEGQEVMAHCNSQYRFLNQASYLTLACTNTGWQNITGCIFCKLIFLYYDAFTVPWNSPMLKL